MFKVNNLTLSKLSPIAGPTYGPTTELGLTNFPRFGNFDPDNGIELRINGQNFFPLLWRILSPSFPVLLPDKQCFDDSASALTKWYLPEYVLKNPKDGGFSFLVRKIGLDKAGNDVFEATLSLKLVEKDPVCLSNVKSSFGPNSTFLKTRLSALNASMVIPTVAGDIVLTPEILTQNAEIELKFSLKPDIVKLLYRTFTEGKANLHLRGQYLGVVSTPSPPSINLFTLAPQAKWFSGRLKDAKTLVEEQALPWQGNKSSNSGFVRLEHSRLEDNGVHLALTTHPKWVGNGVIRGLLPATLIQPNSKFMAKVGFLQGATATDGVDFKVWAHYRENNQQISRQIAELKRKGYSGALAAISADLSAFAGKELSLELRVESGSTSNQDWAVWVDPKIVGQNVELKQASFQQRIALSLPCAQFPDLFGLLKADGTTQAFGCNAPWGATPISAVPPYQVYNKVNLGALGVAAVYMSNYINHQFLIVPSEYQIARDASCQPSAFCTAKVDLNNPDQCKANLDFGLAPAIDWLTLCQIKKAIIQSWVAEDISKTITLVFPDNPLELEWDKTQIPHAQLLHDGNYLFGVGNQFSLSLQGLELLNAELIARNISGNNSPGRRFPFKIKVADQLPLVSCAIELSLNKLSGELLSLPPRTAAMKQLTLQNPMDFDLQIGTVLSETPDRSNNILYELNKNLPAQSAISFDLNPADKGTQFAVQVNEKMANPYALRDTMVSNDEIQQEIVIALAESIFTQAPVEFVEVKLQMKGAAAKASKIFNSVQQLSQKASVSLPLGFYLSSRELEYVAIVRLKDQSEKIVVGALNLREGALLNLSKQYLALP